MKKEWIYVKGLIYVLVVVIMLVNFIGAQDEICNPDWHCTQWSECIEGDQIRSCIDFNLCGVETGKPAEIQECFFCNPNWQCEGWEPDECPETGSQTRNCTDLHNCNTLEDKPEILRSCNYEPKFTMGFVILISIILFLIAIDILLIIHQWEKLNPPESSRPMNRRGPPPRGSPPISVSQSSSQIPPKTTQPNQPSPTTNQPSPQTLSQINKPNQISSNKNQPFTPKL